jgi:hypothetical protein
MAPYKRTQVYLGEMDHSRLRRLAADRGVSMTTIVREAGSHYLADSGAPGSAEYVEPDYEALGIAPGSAGLAARMRARAEAIPPVPEAADRLSSYDRLLGEALWEAHQREIKDWEARRRRERKGS